jgi:hypothetical protein
MFSVGRMRWLVVAGIASIGMVLGHLATCALVQREHHPMFPPVHSWVPLAAVFAAAAVPAVLALAALHAFRAQRSFRALPTGRVLAAIQLPLFLAFEVVERGVAPGPFLLEPGLVLGVLIQVVVVVVGALVLAALGAVVRAISAGRPALAAVDGVPGLPAVNRRPDHLSLLITTRRRAPPPPLAA